MSNLFGIYTRSGNSLSLLTSVSITQAFTLSGTNGTVTALYGGPRAVSAGFSTSLSGGDYWIAQNLQVNPSNNGNVIYGFALVGSGTGASGNFAGYMGQASAATVQGLAFGYGIYTAASAGLPGNPAFSEISMSNTSQTIRYFYGLGVSTT
jgi:hypothetical protein